MTPDRAAIASALLDYFQARAPDPSLRLAPETRLLEDWFLDSIGILEAVLFLESEFGVALQRADITAQTFESVATLTELVASRAGK